MRAWEVFSNGWDTALRIALILLVGIVVRWLLHRTIGRLAEGIATGRTGVGRRTPRAAAALLDASPLVGERRAQRARTIGSVLKSTSTGVVAGIVALLALGEVGINLGPLIAGAGVIGVALGFGSQSLVKDFLSGIFMIVEDQYGVGDVVDLGEATGSVEAVGLRVTRLRDVSGTVWYVRNGEILRVGNMSQGWARTVLDIGVAYGEDIGRVQDLLAGVAHELAEDPDWSSLMLEEAEVWGVEALTADSVVVRLVVKTVPLEQWKVARELRRRIKARFDAEGVEIPFAQRTVWLRQEEQDRREMSTADTGRHEPPPGESDVAADTDKRSDSGL
jgi:small-conductance mechanosensitive channel